MPDSGNREAGVYTTNTAIYAYSPFHHLYWQAVQHLWRVLPLPVQPAPSLKKRRKRKSR
jgi:hypothetical protein